MDSPSVARLLETRAQEILAEAILKGIEAPSEVESRAARDDAKARALRAEAALDATMKRWEEMSKQLENYRAVIDPAKAAQAKELEEQKTKLRMQAANVRQAMEDHGIDRAEFEKKMDENDKLDADIERLLRIVEEGERKENVFKVASALQLADAADGNGVATKRQRLNAVNADAVDSAANEDAGVEELLPTTTEGEEEDMQC